MANNLRMEVITEGVETELFWNSKGCLRCQGYLFGKPVPLTELKQIAKSF
ncbi:MAG: hypothetical protein ACXV8O_08110 [Methylobacter sp.]